MEVWYQHRQAKVTAVKSFIVQPRRRIKVPKKTKQAFPSDFLITQYTSGKNVNTFKVLRVLVPQHEVVYGCPRFKNRCRGIRPECQKGVGRFSGLRDEETNVVAKNRGMAVQEVGGKVDHDLKCRVRIQKS